MLFFNEKKKKRKKSTTLCIMRVPQGEKGAGRLFEETMAEKNKFDNKH